VTKDLSRVSSLPKSRVACSASSTDLRSSKICPSASSAAARTFKPAAPSGVAKFNPTVREGVSPFQ